MPESTSRKIIRYVRLPFEVRLLRLIFTVLVVVPLTMWLAWLLLPATNLDIFIVDKAVFDDSYQEHRSLNWVLTNEKITRPTGNPYRVDRDYWGVFPLPEKQFSVRDIAGYDTTRIDSLASALDLAYFAESYGLYRSEWLGIVEDPPTLLYGGLLDEEVELLRALKTRGKTIVAEFSFLAPPTSWRNRERIQESFNLTWSGWTGKYLESLDTLDNPELPNWVVRLYREQHRGDWPFSESGIVLVDFRGPIVILENRTHLTQSVPTIETEYNERKLINLPRHIEYPYWFDITYGNPDSNQVISWYRLHTNAAGDSILAAHRIPPHFPAVIAHRGPDYTFYYLAGDFSDNPVRLASAKLRWIYWFQTFFHNPQIATDRRDFFWRYYRPLIVHILRTVD
ncbi:MAG: hypothetical protein ABIA75_07695 [Candidatus Neomarinimicrobiota bacterium]